MNVCRAALLAAPVALVVYPALARAEGAEQAADDADALFSRAGDAYRDGDFARSADLFREAFQASPSANTKFNEAQSLRRSGASAAAADAYAEALSFGGLDPPNVATSERKLAELEAELGVLVVDAAAGTTVDVAHVRGAAAPVRVHLTPGSHKVALTAKGGETTLREVTIEAKVVHRLEVTPGGEPSAVLPTSRPETGSPDAVDSTQSTVGWITLGVGAAGGITALVLGVRFGAVLDDYEASGFEDTTLEQDALTLRTATNVVAFASGAVGVAGVVLVLTAPTSPSRASTVQLSASGPLGSLGTTLRGTW